VAWDIDIAFDGPFVPQDVLQPYTTPVTIGGNQVAPVATTLTWTKGQMPLPAAYGVYVVDVNGDPVYAGLATEETIAQRYRGKARGVRELGLSRLLSSSLQNQRVWAGAINRCNGTRRPFATDMVEHWLIRYLLIRDYGRDRRNRKIVNSRRTGEGYAPRVGMNLNFTTPAGMDFLWDAALQDLRTPPVGVAQPGGNARQFTYSYDPGAAF
jgi:hypothetical protein